MPEPARRSDRGEAWTLGMPTGGREPRPGDVPNRFGNYRLLEALGQGTFGRVFRAEDERLRRVVALKVLKTAPHLREVQSQFRVEQAALSRMSSAYVAKLYDTGEEDGNLYFALEYVDGLAITTFCDAGRMALPERLDLFCRLCAGVQHAHQRGVIHRDLKPSNVLVAHGDDGPVPKIIDFGLARGKDRLLVDDQLPTVPGTVLGTLVYMSPEQARGAAVDTRTDVHALGVILYELLAGVLPVGPSELRDLGPVEALARVLQPTTRPSARLAGLLAQDPAHCETIAAARRLSAPQLLGALIGDLDWIVVKATEEDPERRYETPLALAEDVQRYLGHLPVRARPPSRAYRFRKFVRRHRWPMRLGVALALLLLTIAGGALLGMRQARENWRLAGDNERLARAEAEAALARERANALALFQSGDFARTRGDYGKALDLFGRAEATGFADLVLLRIRRVEALDGARRYADAAEELARLAADPALGRRRAKVCLLEADLGIDRLRDPDRNLGRAEEALRLAAADPDCLEPADELYARVLLAADPSEVLPLLRRARAADPYHRRVNDCFGVTLLLHGHVEEARTFHHVLQTLYPGDPQVAFFGLCLAAFDGDRAEAERLVGEVQARFGDGEARFARIVSEACFVKSWGNDVVRQLSLGGLDRTQVATVLLRVFGRVLPVWQAVREATPEDGTGVQGEAFFRIPPAMIRVFRPLWRAATGAEGERLTLPRLLSALDEVSANAIEATVPYLQATMLAVTGQDVRAAAMLHRALELRSGIIERRTALVQALMIGRALLRAGHLDAGGEATLRRDMLAWIAEADIRSDLEADELRVVYAAAAALESDRLPAVVATWMRVAPDDVRAQLALADLLLRQGAAEAACRRARAIELPEDAPEWVRGWRERLQAAACK